MKNFLYKETGHKASDEYFKNMAVWHDIDIMKAFGLGLGLGLIIGIIFF
jgi:hypothetical protein